MAEGLIPLKGVPEEVFDRYFDVLTTRDRYVAGSKACEVCLSCFTLVPTMHTADHVLWHEPGAATA